jgi:hypothetical protein
VRDFIKGGNYSRESRRRGPKVVRARLNNPTQSSMNSENGIIRPDPDNEKSFGDLQTGGDVKPPIQLPGRLMLTITILALIFITIITWLVSRMPEK